MLQSFNKQLQKLELQLKQCNYDCKIVTQNESNSLYISWQYSDFQTCVEKDEQCLDVVHNRAPIINIREWIVYSKTFLVPVLYFQVYCNGHFVSKLDELEQLLNCHDEHLHEAVGMGDHPIESGICWFIHPCQTKSFFDNWSLSINESRYLDTWLSYIQCKFAFLCVPFYESRLHATKQQSELQG
ncbi:autophagy C terminal domain family protein [Schizosaccharomyces japonicus yFS275]|uniref:Ubiquitin-like-conjugating enzyme ATG10 n=1 Tax=Schizosaccharomyces japonicus (strain yFS275 / FY16936) TaxID=402676 RepID=B6K062_SCHJY|nr:autophagy C terminal domain family protein [Schizosaccharomyces japonicus yFS275]EEB06212.1 autophagy C terminal domain family protein [Schizosaccharomyces japonicus yFS275]